MRDELLKRKEHIERCKAFYGEKYNDNGLAFCFDDGRTIEPKRIMRWFSHWQKENGADLNLERVAFHSIRHSSTSYKLVLSGGDIKTVQDETGHKTAKMVTDVYAHTFLSQKDALSDKFDRTFYAPQPDSVVVKDENDQGEALSELLKNRPDMLVKALAALVADKAQKMAC